MSIDGMYREVLPRDHDSERVVVGVLLYLPRAQWPAYLSEEHFDDPFHAWLWRRLDAGDTLGEIVKKCSEMGRLGARNACYELALLVFDRSGRPRVDTVADVYYYAQRLDDVMMYREQMLAAQESAREAWRGWSQDPSFEREYLEARKELQQVEKLPVR